MQEKRRYFRKSYPDYTVSFLRADGTRSSGRCLNLSLGGMHLESPTPPDFGEKVVLVLQLDGIAPESRISSTVRWIKGSAIGVQFGSLGARETYAITKMLSQPSVPPAAPEPITSV